MKNGAEPYEVHDDRRDTSEYWLNEPDEDEPLDEFEEWLGGRCGFMPETGICSEAGSEECEFECPLRDELYQRPREQVEDYWEGYMDGN